MKSIASRLNPIAQRFCGRNVMQTVWRRESLRSHQCGNFGQSSWPYRSDQLLRSAALQQQQHRAIMPAIPVRLFQTRRFADMPSNPTSSSNSPSPEKKRRFPFPKMKREDIYTIPNILSATRLLLSPYIGYCIYHQQLSVAFAVFCAAGITDLLDGYIARRFQSQTFFGSLLDPVADKTLMTILTVSLASVQLLPAPLAALILSRDVALLFGAGYYRYISLPEPASVSKFFDVSLPTVQMRPTFVSKVNTALQLVLMGSTLGVPVLLGTPTHAALTTLQYVVGGTTVVSGLSYLFAKDTVKILRKKASDRWQLRKSRRHHHHNDGIRSKENDGASKNTKLADRDSH